MFENMKKQLKEHLQNASDKEIIRGYKKSKADYERTEDPFVAVAHEIIKKEVERRGLVVEDENRTD